MNLTEPIRHFGNEKETGAEIRPPIVYGIVTGTLWSAISQLFPRPNIFPRNLSICTCCVWLFYLTLLPWEFIYAKLRNFTISKRGWVVNMHKGQSLHWETKTHKLNRSIKAGFKRQLSIKRCVFAYSLFTTAELSLRGGAMGLLWQSVGFTDAQNVGF